MAEPRPARRPVLSQLAAGLALAVGLALFLMAPFGGFSPEMMRAAGLTVGAIGLWATGLIPEHLTALLFFLAAVLTHTAPVQVAFSGFTSTAIWLIFGGLVLGVAVRRTGLGQRLSRRLLGRFAGSYSALIAGVLVLGLLMALVVPSSMGRAVLIMPIVLALADQLGFTPGTKGRTGMTLAAGMVAFMPAHSILPATIPNMILAGSAETLYHIRITYGSWMLLHLPILGLLKAAMIHAFVVRMFPDTPKPLAQGEAAGPLSGAEWRLSAILVAALGLWMTDSLHGINPAWVALGAAALCLWPPMKLVPGGAFNTDIAFSSLFYIAGILGMGAVVGDSGLGAKLGQGLLAMLPLAPGHDFRDFMLLAGLGTGVAMVTTIPGLPAVMTPLAGRIAHAVGWPIETVLMTQVLGYSTLVLPYQAPPLIVSMQLGGAPLGPAVRLALMMAVLTLLLFMPLDFLWWRALALFG